MGNTLNINRLISLNLKTLTDKETTTNITINIGKYLEDDTEYFDKLNSE